MANNFAFEDTLLYPDVEEIIYSGKKKVLFDFKAMVHTEVEEFEIWNLESLDIVRDYVYRVGDQVRIIFQLPLGDYINRLYPYRDNLEVTVKRITLEEHSNERMKNEKIIKTRYKAVFLVKENPPVPSTELDSVDAFSLNTMEMARVTLELYDRSLEPLRVKTVSGVVKDEKYEDVIRALVGGGSLKVLVDGKPSIDGIDIVEPDNKEKRKFTVFPDGTLLTSIPTFLQEREGGVYDGGIGTYLQVYKEKKFWFVYPLFDIRRYDKEEAKVIFYEVPHQRFPQIERTFNQDGEVIKIACTGQKKYEDTGEVSYMNQGSGYRMPDARAYMAKPVEMTADGPKGNRKRVFHEVVTKDRTDNLNFAPILKTGPSMNPFAQRARVLARTMASVNVVWENSDHELIYPGMPCKYTFLSQDKVKSLKGSILRAHTLITKQGNFNSTGYRCVTWMSLAVEPSSLEPYQEPPELPKQDVISMNPYEDQT